MVEPSAKAAARAFVLRQAAAWIEDQMGEASSDTLVDETGEPDPLKMKEARLLAKRLFAQADRIEPANKSKKK